MTKVMHAYFKNANKNVRWLKPVILAVWEDHGLRQGQEKIL
jgi:hypothetical protein